MRSCVIVCVLFLLAMAALPAAADECPPATLASLVGTWEWVQATGGFAGGTYTPADWGYTAQLEFLADGTVLEFRDLALLASADFALDCAGGAAQLACTPDIFGCPSHFVQFGEEGGQPTLALISLCLDGFNYLYVAREPVTDTPATWSAVKALYR